MEGMPLDKMIEGPSERLLDKPLVLVWPVNSRVLFTPGGKKLYLSSIGGRASALLPSERAGALGGGSNGGFLEEGMLVLYVRRNPCTQ